MDHGSGVLGSWQDLWHFSQNFGKVKDRTESEVKGGYQRNKLQLEYIIDASSLFWSWSGFKEKDGWDPGTCLQMGTPGTERTEKGAWSEKNAGTKATLYQRQGGRHRS